MSNTITRKINQNKLSLIISQIPRQVDKTNQNRAFVSLLGIDVFQEYLEEKGSSISSDNDLNKNPAIFKKFDIADIKLENNITIDIRAIVGDDYPQMCIPREQFENNIKADIYVGIRIDKHLETAEIVGFISTESISETKGNSLYYIVNHEEMKDMVEFQGALDLLGKKEPTYYALDHEKAEALFIDFIDNTISDDDEKYLLEHLAGCSDCRSSFNNLAKLDDTLRKESKNLLLESDYTLRVLASDPIMTSGEEVEIEIEEEPSIEEMFTEGIPEEFKSETKPSPAPRDWADVLAANVNTDKKEEEHTYIEEIKPLEEEELAEIDLPEQELGEEVFTERSLDDINLEDEPAAIEQKPIEKLEEEDEVEDILEKLDDVEVLQGEEDIDNILSFFDTEDEEADEPAKAEPSPVILDYITPEPPRVIEELEPVKPVEPQEHEETKDRGDVKFRKGDELGYTSVIEAKTGNEDVNFILEEDITSIETLKQEDLMHIFDDVVVSNSKEEKKADKKDIRTILKTMVEDKSVIAFTVAITLSTTVLFLYLGQIKEHVQIAHNNSNNTNTTLTTQSNNVKELIIKRERKPLKTYTREIIKVVKPKKEEAGNGPIPEKPEYDQNKLSTGDVFNSDFVRLKKLDTKNKPYEINVKTISWELPASVARDNDVKEYFREIGEIIKTTLVKNLSDPKLNAKNSKINIYTELDSKGEIITSKIAEGSGVDQVDKICLNALISTINSKKISQSQIKQDKIKFLLLIRI